ncbi:MAG: fumarylacetoacetate hydrolase family protein [Myxococcota bacterium]
MSPRLIAAIALVGCGSSAPEPAGHVCLDLEAGTFEPLSPPTRAFGLGLTYADHLRETGQSATERPPVFAKAWSPTTATVSIPSAEAQVAALEGTEPGLSAAVVNQDLDLVSLVDYEAELGVVLLADYRPGDVPELGYFVANDLSERAHAVLGEGQEGRYAYWGDSKGHPGFLPTTSQFWRPDAPAADGIPCVTLETRVNGEVRQSQSTADLVYPMSALLDAVVAETGAPLEAGSWVLTGTPSGVALATPAWKVALADLVGMDRFARLGVVLGRADDFLAAGDVVEVSATPLGSVSVTMSGS